MGHAIIVFYWAARNAYFVLGKSQLPVITQFHDNPIREKYYSISMLKLGTEVILKLSIPCIFRTVIVTLIHERNAHIQ